MSCINTLQHSLTRISRNASQKHAIYICDKPPQAGDTPGPPVTCKPRHSYGECCRCWKLQRVKQAQPSTEFYNHPHVKLLVEAHAHARKHSSGSIRRVLGVRGWAPLEGVGALNPKTL